MINGRKENGNYITADGEGNKIEGETRQCIHCQFVWEYGPNAPDKLHNAKTTRGFCLKHYGYICCRDECLKLYGLAPNCKSFEEEQNKIRDMILSGTPIPELGLLDYEVKGNILINHPVKTSNSGILIPH